MLISECYLNPDSTPTLIVTEPKYSGSETGQPGSLNPVKLIKDRKLKVQTAIQGDQLRVSGKKRDDLQVVIALLKEEKFGLPLQFKNFRD